MNRQANINSVTHKTNILISSLCAQAKERVIKLTGVQTLKHCTTYLISFRERAEENEWFRHKLYDTCLHFKSTQKQTPLVCQN